MNFINILNDIANDSITGVDIRYTNKYDAIYHMYHTKDDMIYNIHFDNNTKVNWSKIYHASYDILINNSKDLQVLLWMSEAYLQTNNKLYDILQLIIDFCDKFWNSFYPLDIDHRIQLFDTLNNKISSIIWNSNIINSNISLQNWINLTEEDQNDLIKHISSEEYNNNTIYLQNTTNSLKLIDHLENNLQNKILSEHDISFYKIRDNLNLLLNYYKYSVDYYNQINTNVIQNISEPIDNNDLSIYLEDIQELYSVFKKNTQIILQHFYYTK